MSARTVWSALLLTACLGAQAQVVARAEAADVLDQQLVDTDGDGSEELIVLKRDRLVRYALGEGGWEARGELRIATPAHTLVALADLLPTPGAEVVTCDPRRTEARAWGSAAAVVLAAEALDGTSPAARA